MFSQEEVNKYDTSRFEIIKLDDEVHIIRDRKTGTKGIHFWIDVPMMEEWINSYSTLSLLIKENKDFMDIWVSDPTQLANYESIFEIDGKYEFVESSTEKITAKAGDKKIRIEIDLRNNGSSEYIRLKKI